MPFEQVEQSPAVQGKLGRATVTILGARGLRLSGLNSFHLDEGPDFAWLNIYRTLADARQLEITRERAPESVSLEQGVAVVRWAPTDELPAELSARYRIVPEANAVDVTFGAKWNAPANGFELFIANYFTPYYQPYFALKDNRAHPEGIFWYKTQWFGEHNSEAFPRDSDAKKLFQDGRWLTGHALDWRIGPEYALPLMVQEHRYGHAIVLMARPEDCIGLSGYNSYHNSQYFHLLGKDSVAGTTFAAKVRMVLLTEWEDIHSVAQGLFARFLEETSE